MPLVSLSKITFSDLEKNLNKDSFASVERPVTASLLRLASGFLKPSLTWFTGSPLSSIISP